MAIPLNSLSPAEIEFMAEDEIVTIVPNFQMEHLHFISGSYGPFRPQRPATVPLWLAVTLKKRAKCKIQPPDFLRTETLRSLLEREKSQEAFCPLPFHYMEIAYILFQAAPDDLQQVATLRSLLEDLREIRLRKARQGLSLLNPGAYAYVKMPNMSMMELNLVRPFVLRARDELLDLKGAEEKDDELQPGTEAEPPAGPAVRQRS